MVPWSVLGGTVRGKAYLSRVLESEKLACPGRWVAANAESSVRACVSGRTRGSSKDGSALTHHPLYQR